jgi:hypothetical protein
MDAQICKVTNYEVDALADTVAKSNEIAINRVRELVSQFRAITQYESTLLDETPKTPVHLSFE